MSWVNNLPRTLWMLSVSLSVLWSLQGIVLNKDTLVAWKKFRHSFSLLSLIQNDEQQRKRGLEKKMEKQRNRESTVSSLCNSFSLGGERENKALSYVNRYFFLSTILHPTYFWDATRSQYIFLCQLAGLSASGFQKLYLDLTWTIPFSLVRDLWITAHISD